MKEKLKKCIACEYNTGTAEVPNCILEESHKCPIMLAVKAEAK